MENVVKMKKSSGKEIRIKMEINARDSPWSRGKIVKNVHFYSREMLFPLKKTEVSANEGRNGVLFGLKGAKRAKPPTISICAIYRQAGASEPDR